MSDLTKLHVERLNQLGLAPLAKLTKLNEILLAVLPELRPYPHGQEILLAYEKNISDRCPGVRLSEQHP